MAPTWHGAHATARVRADELLGQKRPHDGLQVPAQPERRGGVRRYLAAIQLAVKEEDGRRGAEGDPLG